MTEAGEIANFHQSRLELCSSSAGVRLIFQFEYAIHERRTFGRRPFAATPANDPGFRTNYNQIGPLIGAFDEDAIFCKLFELQCVDMSPGSVFQCTENQIVYVLVSKAES